MFKKALPFFIHVLSPLHAGSGEALGVVDMPIQRERHTSFPKIEGSSLKGAIREAFEDCIVRKSDNNTKEQNDEKKYKYDIFPPEKIKGEPFELKEEKNLDELKNSKYYKAISLTFGPENGDDHAGALGFTDARLLLFPVKSMKGVFAWITCPMVLDRFRKDMELYIEKEKPEGYEEFRKMDFHNLKNSISDAGKHCISGTIILEEYSFAVQSQENTKKIAGLLNNLLNIEGLEQSIVILSDDDFKDFVNLSTEVITRTKISAETGTVVAGALFTEEYLPPESVLYSLAMATPLFVEDEKKDIFKKNGKQEEKLILEFFSNGIPEVLQIGGNSTIGKGIVEIIKSKENNHE